MLTFSVMPDKDPVPATQPTTAVSRDIVSSKQVYVNDDNNNDIDNNNNTVAPFVIILDSVQHTRKQWDQHYTSVHPPPIIT